MLSIKPHLLKSLSANRFSLRHLADKAGVDYSYVISCLNNNRTLSPLYASKLSAAATELTGHYYHYSDFMPADDGYETDYYQHESRALRRIFDCWLDGHTPDLSQYTAEETQNIYALFERVKDLHREAQNLEVHTTSKRREI